MKGRKKRAGAGKPKSGNKERSDNERSNKERSRKERSDVLTVDERRIASQVMNLAGPLCEAEGMELVHVEYQREARGRMLRLYIDKPGGVVLNDCVCISRQLNDILDVELENSGAYNLEVSSPGLDRPLGKKEDFEKFSGKPVMIRFSRPSNGTVGKKRKNETVKGILMGISEDVVRISVDAGKTIEIPFGEISRARLVNYNGESTC